MPRRRKPIRLCLLLLAQALAVSLLATPGASGQATFPAAAGPTALDGNGMWIWYVSRSGGTAGAIGAKARRYRVNTVLIKSSDGGSSYWRQFNAGFIAQLKAQGLRVCAWQFVYGRTPAAEARLGARAVANGADCLVIDAEGHYEGRYAAADKYVRTLRTLVGPSYPLALATFPYVHYHPGFPYSVFLGPGAAQLNAPQMYWKTIGVSVRRIYEITYRYNRVYKRHIYPLGQTYLRPGRRGIKRFRRWAVEFGARGVSWWSWQETNRREWRALSRRPRSGIRRYSPRPGFPALAAGSRGDLVVWAQQLLNAHGKAVPVTGVYGSRTRAAVQGFQAERGLTADGKIGAATWAQLLTKDPIPVPWSSRAALSAGGQPREPLSAGDPAVRYEIPRAGGR